MSPTRYIEPTSVSEVCEALRDEPEAKILSGGTALVLMMRQGLIEPALLVSLGRLSDLNGIEERDGSLWIGARTPLQDIADSPLVWRRVPSLAHACGQVANVRVRNIATLGGNLAEADYASDPPPVLASLGATVLVTDGAATRRVPAADFVTDFYTTVLSESEVVTAVEVPFGEYRSATYLKYRTRSSEDRPCVGVAARVDRDGSGTVTSADVVVGAVAATTQRFPDLVRAAVGSGLSAAAVAELAAGYAERIRPLDDARGSAWYRRQVIEVMVRRALEELATPAAGPKRRIP